MLLEQAIKSQEAIVILRSLAVKEAMDAKRDSNKYNSELQTELKQNIENAQNAWTSAIKDLSSLYEFKASLQHGEVLA